jgi:hypothetical protein
MAEMTLPPQPQLAAASPPPARYPVSVDVAYPARQSRWKALFRLPLSIPVLILSWLLGSALYGVVLVMWVVVLLRGRIPHWMFDAVVATNRVRARARAYLLLLSDAYPPFEGAHELRYDVVYPERTSRWRLVIWKLISSVPHLIAVQALNFVALAVLPIAWAAIIITGRFPKGLHEFVSGVVRWERRVEAYLLSLTDEFPPFSTAADAAPVRVVTQVIVGVAGLLITAGTIGGIVALVLVASGRQTNVPVSYAGLLAGRVNAFQTTVVGDSLVIALNSAQDPADATLPILNARTGYHFVSFHMTLVDQKRRQITVREFDFELKDSNGKHHGPFLALVNGRTLPEKVARGDEGGVDLVFEVKDGLVPAQLKYYPTGYRLAPIAYQFH